ncbi:MAG: hypothetical protein IJD38_02980 [Clostridia bacterium]|nr:hypothetical protein [Clostridia bacterium]
MNPSNNLATLVTLQNRIQARKGLLGCAHEYTVALHDRGKAVYTGANTFGQGEITSAEGIAAIACASEYLMALLEDGTLRGEGNRATDSRLKDLSHVRAVACSDTHGAALLGNGRVVVGMEAHVKGDDTSEWPAVFDLVCGKGFTAGLTREGRVVVAGGSRMLHHILDGWRDVAGIFTDARGETLLGITVDGRLISTKALPRRCREWKNLVFVAADRHHIWGITATGQLLSTHEVPSEAPQNGYYVACSASEDHAAALTRDGYVVAWGSNRFGQCDTQRFGSLFGSLEECSAVRRVDRLRMAATERTYQVRLVEAQRYSNHLACGERVTACISADGRVLTSGSYGRAREWNCVRSLACGNAHVVALHEDGTVSADGNDVEGCTAVSDWRDIKAVCAGKYHTLGLTESGTVLYCGQASALKDEITAWKGIRCMEATDEYAVGIGYDGSIHVAGKLPFSRDILRDGWNRPTALAVTPTHMSALYANGCVKTTVMIPAGDKPGDGEVNLTYGWQGIRSIAAGKGFTVGLSYGGRVLSSSVPGVNGCDTSRWRDVVSVGCGFHYAAGLTADGRVMIACTHPEIAFGGSPLPDTSLWKDVLTMKCGPYHMVALTSGGQILSCGLDTDRQCSATTHFALFRDPRQLYGYGRYSRRLELEIRAHQEADRTEPVFEVEEGILPFNQIAGTLREDTRRLLARLDGSDSYLSVLNEEGKAATYLYGTAEIYTDGCQSDFLQAEEPLDAGKDLPLFGGQIRKEDIVSVVSSRKHTVVLLADGHVKATGRNESGECRTEDWRRVIQIVVMPELTLGLRADGRVLAAGRHHKVLETLEGVRAIACFGEHRQVFVMADGTIRIHRRGSEYLPEPIAGLRLFTPSVAHSVLNRVIPDSRPLLTARSLRRSWGLGMTHTVSLGKGGLLQTDSHFVMKSLQSMVQVASGPYHMAAIRADGLLYMTGRTSEGQCDYRLLNENALGLLGMVSEDVRGTTAPTTNGSDSAAPAYAWKQVACGYTHTAALRSDGRVFAVGAGPDGRCDTRKWRDVTEVTCGVRHTLAVTADGTCLAVGDNRQGQCDVSLWKQITMVAAGEFHSVGLRADGRVEAVGDNRKGQCRVEDLRDIISVACLPEATLCVTADGRVIIRGGSGEHDKAVEALREIVAVHACEHRIAALTLDGRMILIP